MTYHVLYSSFRRRDAEHYAARSNISGLVLWHTGAGEWQVRIYKENKA